jgi:hypothetical protein
MGALPHDPATQPLHIWALLGLSAANLLLTPLAGMAIWHGLRDDRPVAARQSLQITLPVAVGLTLFWMSLLLNQLVS